MFWFFLLLVVVVLRHLVAILLGCSTKLLLKYAGEVVGVFETESVANFAYRVLGVA